MTSYVKLYSNEYFNDVKTTLNIIYEDFQENGTLFKEDLLEILPEYLNKPTTTKADFVARLGDEIYEEDFVKLLMMQTLGRDYPSFEYLISKYNLDIDNNYMIKFTKEFPFDRKIKKEALFIWGIINALNNHELLGPYINLYDLQASYETDAVTRKDKKKYDMEFTDLNIAIEIDENHTEAVKENDELKNHIAAMNGRILLRMDFQEIYKDKGASKGKGEIKAGQNANKYMLNSTYYSEFLQSLYDALINSLLNNDAEFRKTYIMYLFVQSLNNQIDTISNDIKSNKKRLKLFKETMKNTKSTSKKDSYETKISYINNIQEKNTKSIADLTEILEFIKTDESFYKLFYIKDKYRPKYVGEKNIPFEEIISLLIITQNESISELLDFLYDHRIVSKYYKDKTNILISWKDLSIIIMEFISNSQLSKTLILYYLELEESYESIINRMYTHTQHLIPTEEKYKICMDNEIAKSGRPLEAELAKQLKATEKAETALEKLKNKFNILVSKFTSINLSYNKLINGQFNHRRSEVNIKFNKSRVITRGSGSNSDDGTDSDNNDSDFNLV